MLSKRLKQGTKKSHSMAENTGFITCFLKGVIDKKSYIKLTSDLYHIYSAMEDEFESHKSDPILKNIYYPELFRKKSLEKDLEYYLGKDWESKITQTESCKKYVNRIRYISKNHPYLLIAHHYTRYIGDLSGGQILKGIAKTSLDVDDSGLNFYIFDDIDDPKEFKNNYRNCLDSISFGDTEINLIVTEANNAFKYNMNVFKEIEGNLISTIGKMLFLALTKHQKRGSTEND